MSKPILEIDGLAKRYVTARGVVHAFADVGFSVAPGETVALVGESGCGKTSLAKTIFRLQDPDAGSIRLGGTDITRLSRGALRPHRRRMQMVFQDPYASLNPRATVGDILEAPLKVHGLGGKAERAERVRALLAQVGLSAEAMDRYPHQFSGGQRQRVGIARALALDPEVLICDEPVSALDISVQSQVLNLLTKAQAERGLAMLFISHDLSVVRHVADRVLVMYLGRVVESGTASAVLGAPAHPYTRALLSAAPIETPGETREARIVLSGELPSPFSPPSGCRFHTRCAHARPACGLGEPAPREISGVGRRVACHLVEGADEAGLRRPWD